MRWVFLKNKYNLIKLINLKTAAHSKYQVILKGFKIRYI